MPNIKIFTKQEEIRFSTPPQLEKSEWVDIILSIKGDLKRCKSASSKLDLVLQTGYFRSTHRFFKNENFNKVDIDNVITILNVNQVSIKKYNKDISYKHRKSILQNENVLSFEEFREPFTKEVKRLIKKYIRPREIFKRLIEFLEIYKVEIPSLFQITREISQSFNQYEDDILNLLDQLVTGDDRFVLDDILSSHESLLLDLPQLRAPNQSLKPGMIKKIVTVFNHIQCVFTSLEPLYESLSLPDEAFNYYASWTLRATNQQLRQLKDDRKKWIYLLSFVHYQYVTRQDYLIDIVLQSHQHFSSKVEKLQGDRYLKRKQERKKAFEEIVDQNKSLVLFRKKIKNIIEDQNINSDDKINDLKIALKEHYIAENQQIQFKDNDTLDYHEATESIFKKLNNRVGDILKIIRFNPRTSNKELIEAIDYYQTKKYIGKLAPIGFLIGEKPSLYITEKGRMNTQRYRYSLFSKITENIKSGSLNLIYSSKYLSIEEYLIKDDYWNIHKKDIIKQSNLEQVTDVDKTIRKQLHKLNEQYIVTNNNINNGNNEYVRIDKKGKYFVKTPSIHLKNTSSIRELIQTKLQHKTPLIDLLHLTQSYSNFLEEFQHLNLKSSKKKPLNNDKLAVLVAYGCNIGITQMTQSTKGVNREQLLHLSKWFFSIKNLQNANENLAKAIDKLEVSKLLIQDKDERKTASDGQKMNVKSNNPTLNASYSYKYFGKGKGISINSFVDEKNLIFHTNVLSSSDRESMYLIDGLVNQNIVKTKWHTTDTEGFTEVVFAVTNLMGIQYAPRIKKYKNQTLYTDSKEIKDRYIKNGFCILPQKMINTTLIKENWENILKFVSTIMLRDVTPSQLFKRLNSYSKQHPIYSALKEYGKIIKSQYILKYYDDLELRQTIEYRLNMVELTQKFSRAVFFGNNQEIEYETIEEQNIAMLCKQLIQNSIILWNYIQLTTILIEAKNEVEKNDLIEVIKNGNVLTWKHINFYGEYDFSKIDQLIENDYNFEFIKNYKIE